MKIFSKIFTLILSMLLVSCYSHDSIVKAATDKSKPTLNSFTINKSSVYPSDNVLLETRVSDKGTGVAQVQINYTLPKSKKVYKINLTKKSSTVFQGKLFFDSKSEQGAWNPVSIYIKDKAKNSNTYYNKYNNIYKKTINLKNFNSLIFTVKPITNSPITPNDVTNSSTAITGTAKTGSKVYAIINNKIVNSANTVNGKFKIPLKPQEIGTKITIYSDFKGVLSKKIDLLVSPALSDINYYDPATVAKIKTDSIQTLDGLTLDKPFSKYSNFMFLSDEEGQDDKNKFYIYQKDSNYYENHLEFKNTVLIGSIHAIFDFPDNPLKQPKVNRIVHNVMYLEPSPYKRSYMLQLYGKPNGEDTVSGYVGYYGDVIVDFYDNVTFVYKDTNQTEGYYLSDVIYLGGDIKNNADVWKSYVKIMMEDDLDYINKSPITQENWDKVNS